MKRIVAEVSDEADEKLRKMVKREKRTIKAILERLILKAK